MTNDIPNGDSHDTYRSVDDEERSLPGPEAGRWRRTRYRLAEVVEVFRRPVKDHRRWYRRTGSLLVEKPRANSDGWAAGDAVLEILESPPQSAPSPRRHSGSTGMEPHCVRTGQAPIRITVFGPPRVYYDPQSGEPGHDGRDITAVFQPRVRELLVFLALRPTGVVRDVLVDRLWAEASMDRPTNALNTAVTRLRRSIAHATQGAVTDMISLKDGVYRLDPAVVRVDYWRFADAVAASRSAASDDARIAAYHRVVHSYGGPLAEGLDVEWLEVDRESTRRDALDAVAALARALVERDPQQTLDLLEVAIAFDPYNELLYRDIMRLQERLGHLDAISRTMTLLATRLKEIDAVAMPQTVDLAARLQQRRDVPAEGGRHA